MKISSKFLTLFVLSTVALLQGCASSQEAISNLRQYSDRQLCMEYMTLPSMNFYHSERETVIRERRLDCWKFGNVADERRKADAAFQQGLQGNRVVPQQVIIQQQNNNPNACIQDGGGIYCPNHPNTRR